MPREHFICWPQSSSAKVRNEAWRAAHSAGLLPGDKFTEYATAEAAQAAIPALRAATGVQWVVEPCTSI